MARQCENCQVCCWFDPVVPLNKPEKARCVHQCAAGCGIYPTRPSCCATYHCSWLSDRLPEWAKPDRCGIILETLFLPLNGRPRLVMGFGEAFDPVKALSFESQWESLCEHGMDVVSIIGLPVDRFEDGMVYIARDQEVAGIFTAWMNKVKAEGALDMQYADGEKRTVLFNGENS